MPQSPRIEANIEGVIPTGFQELFFQPNSTKAELLQEGILFRTQFPSLGVFINKKVGFQKN